MSDRNLRWYLPGEANKPLGPFPAERIIELCRAGQIPAATLCRREDMLQWHPLGDLEPFASALGGRAAPGRGGHRLYAVIGGAMAAVAVGLAAYFLLSDPPEIAQAKGLIASERYVEARRVLTGYVAGKPNDLRALYLMGISIINEYATGGDDPNAAADPNQVQAAREALQQAMDAGGEWRAAIKGDLAQASARVPAKAPDAVARTFEIALLRAKLGAAEFGQLAKDVIAAAAKQPVAAVGTGPFGSQVRLRLDKRQVSQVLKWDPSVAEELVNLVLPVPSVATMSPDALALVVHELEDWAKEGRELAMVLAQALESRKEECDSKGAFDQAQVLCASVEVLDPARADEMLSRWGKGCGERVAAGEAAAAVGLLDRYFDYVTHRGADAREVYAVPYLKAAHKLRAKDAPAAHRAVLRAKKLDPEVLKSEEDHLLALDVAPQPSDAKMVACQEFLRAFPRSAQAGRVLLVIVENAVKFFDESGPERRNQAQRYLQPGFDAAMKAIQQFPQAADIEARVFELAERFASVKRREEAASLLEAYLKAVPNTPSKARLEARLAQWQQPGQTPPQPEPEPPQPDAGRLLEVETAADLSKALADDPKGCILWVRLDRQQIGDVSLSRLQNWVRAGRVLWVDTDLARSFEFSNVRTAPKWFAEGQAKVSVSKEPALKELSGTIIDCKLADKTLVMIDLGAGIGMATPLLERKGAGNNVVVLWAVRAFGKGWVVYRGAAIDATTDAGRRLEKGLYAYSQELAQRAAAAEQPAPPAPAPAK
jgi:hypothetical protein